jgi:hypothetical protein
MMNILKLWDKKLWLCVAPFTSCLLDKSMTLLGQPARYWAGDYAKYYEGNPITAYFLARNPAAYLVYTLVQFILYGLIIMLLPKRLAMITALAITILHFTGAATWIWLSWKYEGLIIPVLAFLMAGLVVWTWARYTAI